MAVNGIGNGGGNRQANGPQRARQNRNADSPNGQENRSSGAARQGSGPEVTRTVRLVDQDGVAMGGDRLIGRGDNVVQKLAAGGGRNSTINVAGENSLFVVHAFNNDNDDVVNLNLNQLAGSRVVVNIGENDTLNIAEGSLESAVAVQQLPDGTQYTMANGATIVIKGELPAENIVNSGPAPAPEVAPTPASNPAANVAPTPVPANNPAATIAPTPNPNEVPTSVSNPADFQALLNTFLGFSPEPPAASQNPTQNFASNLQRILSGNGDLAPEPETEGYRVLQDAFANIFASGGAATNPPTASTGQFTGQRPIV